MSTLAIFLTYIQIKKISMILQCFGAKLDDGEEEVGWWAHRRVPGQDERKKSTKIIQDEKSRKLSGKYRSQRKTRCGRKTEGFGQPPQFIKQVMGLDTIKFSVLLRSQENTNAVRGSLQIQPTFEKYLDRVVCSETEK